MVAANADFLKRAAAYDSAGPELRSLIRHEAWMASQTAPVFRLDSSMPVRISSRRFCPSSLELARFPIRREADVPTR